MFNNSHFATILLLWAVLIPQTIRPADYASTEQKITTTMLISAANALKWQTKTHNCAVQRLPHHKQRLLRYSKLLSTASGICVDHARELQAIDPEKPELLNCIEQRVILTTGFERSPPPLS